MATVNLGSIKFNWQGAYNGATAYAVDDVVSYNGSSYICKLASTGNLPTNTTYFDQMSSAGTNGTDLTSTLTTQGDLVYRDGSGLQRLGAGTAGQVLQTGGAGANPSWGTVSSDYVLLDTINFSGATTYVDWDFSSYVSASYNTYKVYIENWKHTGISNQHYLRMMTNNVPVTSTEYRFASIGATSASSTLTNGNPAAGYFSIHNDGSSTGNDAPGFFEITINNPKSTKWKALLCTGVIHCNNTDWRIMTSGCHISTSAELNGLRFSAQDTVNALAVLQAKLYGIKG